MSSIVDIKKLTFKYDKTTVLNNMNLKLDKGKWYTICGSNGSGKTTFIKVLLGLLNYKGIVKFDSKLVVKSELESIRSSIGVIFENVNNQFIQESVYDEIAFKLHNLGIDEKEIESRVKDILKYFDIEKLEEVNPHNLTNSKKQVVAFASIFVSKPKLIVIDEALNKCDYSDKMKTINLLKEGVKEGMTVLNVTNNPEDAMYSDEVIIFNKGEIFSKGTLKEVFSDEVSLNKIGVELPFIVLLSHRLKFYDLLDDIILDMESMVDKLWK